MKKPFTLWHHFVVPLLCLLLLSVKLSGANQQERITLNLKNVSITQFFKEVEQKCPYKFFYKDSQVDSAPAITINAENLPLAEILIKAFEKSDLTYEISGNQIVIKQKTSVKKVIKITGVVLDKQRIPISGVAVLVTGTKKGVNTDNNGEFSIELPSDQCKSLDFSMIGMLNINLPLIGKNYYEVIMEENATTLKDVVVTGIVNRRAESFTGSSVTVKKEELLKVGNQNILQSLKNIDPSFNIVDNIDLGSDPNTLPSIQMRGQNSITNLQGEYSGNPNQPLFILDGFETTLQKVYDLDMNRVSSVTLLKDASAKAIYGSKAANGVVVIETIRPKTGELRISYSGDINIEAPDLSGYNLMNAKEKLAFEKERGMYFRYVNGSDAAQNLDNIYKQNYDNVVKGVDTYWLSKPLRTGVGTKHSVNLEGGDSRMRYQAGVSYNNVAGVMKGSGRNTFLINTTLSYTYKNLIFRNSVEYTNNQATNSPYGSFSEYTKLNQYYQPYDENGNAFKILGINSLGNVYNPLYNATLNTKSESGYSEFTDNFNIDWKINSALRATGNVSYTRTENRSDIFYPASHTMFAEYDQNGLGDRKGRYTKGNGYSQYITANAGINYNKTFGRHLIFANATWNLSSQRAASTSVVAEGFGNDYMDNISFASQYEYMGKPSGSDNKVREIGVIGVLNYSYADRYLFDASIRTSGSSMYGSDNRWGTFWSLGAGWNVHHEKFMENLDWLTQLKIRSSLGYTGSQNFNPFQARARYEYGDIVYNGRLGAELLGLPNNSLRWQRTMDFNTGFDLALKKFIIARFDYYVSSTSDLLSDLTIVPSMGFSSYKENLGEVQNKGYEFSLAVTPWRDDKNRGWLTFNVSALHNTNKIKKIYDIFTSWNESQDKITNLEITSDNYENLELLRSSYTRPKTYYYEGQSMTAIWGVRSLGIDPITGAEMYLDKNGNSTFTWSTADKVVIGDTSPKLRGNIGLNAGYNGFSIALICSYKFGGDLYNTTMVDRIENVTGFDNLDRRILDSWRKVGDISQYKALEISGSASTINYTKPTSRFVQKDNELYISSLNVGYDFYKKNWLRKIGLEHLKCSFYMNELLRMSNVKIERGTSYPFARTFSLSLQATF